MIDIARQVIPKITKKSYPDIKAFIGQSESVEITGDMAKKVEEFLEISSLGIDCWIIDGTIKGNLANAVLGKPTLGTLISAFTS